MAKRQDVDATGSARTLGQQMDVEIFWKVLHKILPATS